MSDKLVGAWVSPTRDTHWGPMVFDFQFGADGNFEVTGTPVTSSSPEKWQRKGRYRLEGNRFLSSVINEGKPVEIQIDQADGLRFKIDDSLSFRLGRR
jgi:hypothetical protein